VSSAGRRQDLPLSNSPAVGPRAAEPRHLVSGGKGSGCELLGAAQTDLHRGVPFLLERPSFCHSNLYCAHEAKLRLPLQIASHCWGQS
jgi:hypothetical protein